ncbi:MAG TPA: DUF2950 domain-containing protein [Burkholderiales bacterium]|nr:DUF2950 domain-containing protein [Burkholderiales bacterium]
MGKTFRRWSGARLAATCGAVSFLALTWVASAASPAQKSFESPEVGASELVEAVKANDVEKLRAILGPHSRRLISSGDDVADAQRREDFVKEYGEANRIVLDGETRATLLVGEDEWPLPIPLVKSGGRWHFDSSQGEREILARRIGANELAAIQVCMAIVDAENDYAEQARTSDGVPHYASRFVSHSGKHDGLYWDTAAGEPSSPLGPLLAAAASEGYKDSSPRVLAPYHGYYYKILTGQGAAAPGGAYDYIVKDRMLGGFAVLAWPAKYGASGVMSFMVNHDGVVYEKNLGRHTATVVSKISKFNPDKGWKIQQARAE